MRRRILTWFVLSLLIVAALFLCLRSGKRSAVVTDQTSPSVAANAVTLPDAEVVKTTVSESTAPVLISSETSATTAAPKKDWLSYRLTNTKKTSEQLLHDDKAILLENALIETDKPLGFTIPEKLRAVGDPGSYIVQSRGPVDAAFRAALADAGATLDIYIPNNAFLVRLDAQTANRLAASPVVQSVLPYEPAYKLKSELLQLAFEEKPLPRDTKLNLLVFTDAYADVVAKLQSLGWNTLAEDSSPFGKVITVDPGADWTVAALWPGVQLLETAMPRISANDLSRVRVGVAANSLTATNYLGLTGSNILVAITDSGVDWLHPDLTNRVFANNTNYFLDTSGHGTHVAGIIAGSGAVSATATNARGSINITTNNTHFRGMANGAKLFVQNFNGVTDSILQETTAQTNALISNNSWTYTGSSTYSLAAASYDAAVRDSLPGVTGSQPVLYVFAGGNGGGGSDSGLSGNPGSLTAPGTAKNVITVGTIELARDITNIVTKYTKVVGSTNGEVTTNTSTPWKNMTSSGNQVAGFSARGNVGIGTEGDFGRFKPDVVAPGTFVISTRSQNWDEVAYYNPTNHHFTTLRNRWVKSNTYTNGSVFLPDNAVGFTLTVYGNENSPDPFPDLPIYVRHDNYPNPLSTAEAVGTNFVGVPPTLAAGPGAFVGQNWFYSVDNKTGDDVSYNMLIDVITTNDLGDYYNVLSNLNNSLGGDPDSLVPPHYYRYESGTSMSAAGVSGTLALMQQFFEQTMLVTNSPAMMKALLINGARSVGNIYDFQVRSSINYQGWGLVKLNNILPPGIGNAFKTAPADKSSVKLFDQSPTNALATGNSKTRFISLDESGRTLPLRITMAYTDPPGNPAAGVKLVNDLDLVVTNLDTGDIYLGNDIPGASTFTFPWDTNAPPNLDAVNNVENVYIAPALGMNYSITVIGRRVNVNAVTAHTNDIVQDYALVISSGNGEATNALTLVSQNPMVFTNQPSVSYVSNSFSTATFASGSLLNQRVGANTPMLVSTNGGTNQWRFYAMTNTTAFTNATFLVSQLTDLGTPRMGVFTITPGNSTRQYADIDMYVSLNPTITNLVPGVVSNSFKSQGRNELSGDEFVIFTNSVQNDVYFIGVKSEDQMAAQFEFWGIFSLLPLGEEDPNGYVQAYPMSSYEIPDGSPAHPGGMRWISITRPSTSGATESVRLVVVTNNISHENFGDVIGTLDHNSEIAVLNNHRGIEPPLPAYGPYGFLYDDSGEGNFPNSIPPDGPGTFENFVGLAPGGTWYFTFSDDGLTQTGRVDEVKLKVERQREDNSSSTNVIAPNSWRYFSRNIPVDATNLTVCLNIISPSPRPLQLYIRKDRRPTQTAYDYTMTINPSGCLSVDKFDLPPLTAGRYFIGVFNGNPGAQTFVYTATVLLGEPPTAIPFNSAGGLQLLDDAVTNFTTFVADNMKIAQLDVGLRIDHPRVSDLAVTLISPKGTRVLLVENRGGLDTNGFGSSLSVTNFIPVGSTGGQAGQTNFIDTGSTVGSVTIDYDFFGVPDQMTVYYQGVLLYDTGMTNGAARLTLNYGPGTSTIVEVRMNEFGNTNATTGWNYTVSSYNTANSYLVFTENTNKTTTPVKFALPPFIGTTGTNIDISLFEAAAAGDYIAPTIANPDGWNVLTNQVTVVADPFNAQAGTNFLALAKGTISRVLPTTSGRTYSLTFWHRGPGAVGWWRAENNGVDQIYGNTGSVEGGATFAPGEVGQSFQFASGSTRRVSVPDQTVFQLTNSLAIEGWIRPTGAGSQILWRGDRRGGFDPYFLQMNSDTTLSFIIANDVGAGGTSDIITAPLAYNQWWHVVGMFNGNTGAMSIYTNGVLAVQKVTAIRPFAVLDVNEEPTIGIGNVGTHDFFSIPFTGNIDEISLYSRSLSASEIKAIYNAGTAGKFNPGVGAPANLAEMVVSLSGQTNTWFGNNTNWQQRGMVFTATTNAAVLSLAGFQPGMLLDTFKLSESSGPRYVLPEESLEALVGENAYGNWKLEIWDSRVGAILSATTLVDWQLQFVFQTNTPIPIVLQPSEPQTNDVPAGGIKYLIVDVPAWATMATNTLIFATGPLDVWFNQNTPPTGVGAGDFNLLPVSTGGTRVLYTNGVPPPPLLPGQRYYLGLQNNTTNNITFGFRVDYDMTELTNNIPITSVHGTGSLPRYFFYDVSTNAVAVSFNLYDMDGNMNLVARRGTPLPTLASYDYGSFNPGLIDEDIVVFTNSAPVPLAAGRWYLGVFNAGVSNVNYTIEAREFENLPEIITLTNGIAYPNTNTGTGINSDYYRYVVTPDAARVQFEIYGMSANMTLVARKGLPLPGLGFYDAISANAGTNDEIITVFTNTGTILLTPGSWYLSAINLSGGAASYSIKATEWAQNGRPIIITDQFMETNSFCITWNSLPGVRYHVEALPDLTNTIWTTISPTIIATDITTTWCVPLPSPYHFFRVAEEIGNGTGLFGFPAFPGAEGPGAYAVGGRGGDVYHVTNLNDDGPGSLRFGLRAVNRTIVFDISGTITFNSDLNINRSFITIAGQTAPGDGITLRRRSVSVMNNSDVVIRFIRFRSGDLNCPVFQGDSLNFNNSESSILDHVSSSWSIDEALSATASRNVTVQWSLITESLNNSCHLTSPHGYGALLRYGFGQLSYHHNLFSANYSRNPRLGDNLTLDFVNNVIYNWGDRAGYSEDDIVDNPAGYTNRLNYVGNYLIAGASTASPNTAFTSGTTNTWIYQSGNRIDTNLNLTLDGADNGAGMFVNPYTPVGVPFAVLPVQTDSAEVAYERVLAFSGAAAKRDIVDLRLISDVRNHTGTIIDTTAAVGGWPVLNSTPVPVDTDRDGMPNFWETTLGLNPLVAGNNNDRDLDGYTDIEEYINWLAAPHAMVFTNTFVDVDLREVVGGTGTNIFSVANGTNGAVVLLGNGYTARFTPVTPLSGFGSFTFGFADAITGISVNPVTVSVLVNSLVFSPATPPTITSSVVSTNGLTLGWTSDAGRQFRAQWATNVAPPIVWNTFTNIITSAGTNYTFLDDGVQTGGFGPMRFYRLLNFP